MKLFTHCVLKIVYRDGAETYKVVSFAKTNSKPNKNKIVKFRKKINKGSLPKNQDFTGFKPIEYTNNDIYI